MCAHNSWYVLDLYSDEYKNQVKFTNSLRTLLSFEIIQASKVHNFSTCISTSGIWLLLVQLTCVVSTKEQFIFGYIQDRMPCGKAPIAKFFHYACLYWDNYIYRIPYTLRTELLCFDCVGYIISTCEFMWCVNPCFQCSYHVVLQVPIE